MFIYVQASDYDRFLRIDVEPDELVRNLKAKINQELGGNVPEDVIDSLNYVGITLDCSTPLRNYGIEESSLLYIGRNPHAGYIQQAPSATAIGPALSAQPIASQAQTLSQQAQLVQPQYQTPVAAAYQAAYQPYAAAAAAYPTAQAAYPYYAYPSY
jgi:hypothetical protein